MVTLVGRVGGKQLRCGDLRTRGCQDELTVLTKNNVEHFVGLVHTAHRKPRYSEGPEFQMIAQQEWGPTRFGRRAPTNGVAGPGTMPPTQETMRAPHSDTARKVREHLQRQSTCGRVDQARGSTRRAHRSRAFPEIAAQRTPKRLVLTETVSGRTSRSRPSPHQPPPQSVRGGIFVFALAEERGDRRGWGGS